MTLHCNLTWGEEAAAIEAFEPLLSNEEEEALSQKFTQYVFYETWGRRDFRECVCTRCGRFEAEKDSMPRFFKMHHNDEIECPRCGTDATLYALGRMKTGESLTEYRRAAFLRPGPNGAALISAGYGKKEYSRDDLMPGVQWIGKVRTYLAPGKRGQWKRYIDFGWGTFWGTGKWEREETVREPFSPFMYQSDGSYWWLLPERINETALRYCALEKWYNDRTGADLLECDSPVRQIHRYLAAYTEYPQMEMAVKIGFHGAVEDLVITGKKNHKYLNWRAKTLPEFLRLDKQEAKTFLKQERVFLDLVTYKDGKQNGTFRDLAQYLDIVGRLTDRRHLEQLTYCAKAAGVGLNKAMTYLESQTPQCARAAISTGTILQYWKDYLDMAAKLQYDLTEQTVALPKDLKDRHDTAASLIKVQESNEARKKYKPRYKRLRDLYEFSFGDLTIVVPESSAEIMTEGNVLHHCVGGYRYDPDHFEAGVGPVAKAVKVAAADLAAHAPVALDADGKLTAVTADNNDSIYGLLPDSAKADEEAPVYLTGEFFADSLALEEGVTAADIEVALRNIGIFLR